MTKHSILTLALLLGACGTAAEGTYDGEPLISVSGQVAGEIGAAPKDPYVGIMWNVWAGAGPDRATDQPINAAEAAAIERVGQILLGREP